MNSTSRVSAVLAYIPIIGWIYVLTTQRKNGFAMFHLRQSIGLVLFLIGVFVGWAIVFWLLSWIPIGDIVGIVLFTLVISAYLYGVLALVLGLINAASNKVAPLPFFGQWANRLPIR